jgi:polar amino acid transport system ATP-binding protein
VALPDVGLDRPVAALSVGEQQRVCLARALALRPQILMLDETTASLEPPTARAVLERLYRRVEEDGLTLLHVTHEVPKLRALDRIVVLAAGGVAEEGTPRRILERPQVEVTREFVRGLD